MRAPLPSFAEKRSEQEAPRFAHLSFIRPHPPFVVPEPFVSMYSPDDGPDFVRAADLEAEAAQHPFLTHALRTVDKCHFGHGADGGRPGRGGAGASDHGRTGSRLLSS